MHVYDTITDALTDLGYGVYAENILPELLNKLKIHHE